MMFSENTFYLNKNNGNQMYEGFKWFQTSNVQIFPKMPRQFQRHNKQFA